MSKFKVIMHLLTLVLSLVTIVLTNKWTNDQFKKLDQRMDRLNRDVKYYGR